jgi:hypothetical protein
MRAALFLMIGVCCTATSARGGIICLCPAPYRPLAEQAQHADVIASASWVSVDQKESPFDARTSFRLAEVVRSSKWTAKPGELVSIPAFTAGKRNQLFLLLGRFRSGRLEWDDPLPWNADRGRYLRDAPLPTARVRRQISFFARHLDAKDAMIAEDAHHVLDHFRYRDLIQHADVLPRDSLRKLLANPHTPRNRKLLFGMLLGFCGRPADAMLLETIMLRNPAADEVRLEIEGVMTGYLWLTGKAGLQRLEETKLLDGSEEFSERYFAMSAVRFLLDNGKGRIERERLLQSLRHLLDDTDIAELVVHNLARHKDWSVQDRLMKKFGDPRYGKPFRRAAVKFMLHCEADAAKTRDGKPPLHVLRARAYLRQMEHRDPQAFAAAKRWFE